MAIREILYDDDALLRKKSKEQKVFDDALHILLDDMKETMHENDGMGLAAVQVGVLKRIFIVEANNMFLEFVNPVINHLAGEEYAIEGCLSIPAAREYVARPTLVSVSAFDRYGNPFTIIGVDDLARVICHEYDHLEGILFTDRSVKQVPENVKTRKKKVNA